MDEDDSQDEVTGRSSSCRKGKRPLSSIFSDEEDDSDESGEGETDSGDDNDDDVGDESEVGEDEETLDGDDDEDEEEDEEEDDSDRDEIDAAKAGLEGGVGRAVGGSSAEFSYLSSDEDAEKCPICLNTFHEQPVATPETCEHYFCLDCILEWSKNANSCPVDRIVFNKICLRKNHGGQVQKVIPLQKPLTAEGGELDQTNCEVCGQSDREDRLLLCDGCDAGYHMECLTPPLDAVPVEEWFCPRCSPSNVRSGVSSMAPGGAVPTTSRRARAFAAGPTRAIARTQQSERVRANVNRNRITQARTSSEAPMLSSWLDEAINAVVAGLSTAVYVRDLTPRPGTSRRRRTVKRRKTAGKKMNEKTGGKMDGKEKPKGKGVKRRRRRRRRVRRTKSRRKLVVKKDLTARSRIAKNLGLGKPTHSTSIPSVYRPIEQSLGGMRADIGAASLSVYGDPFDLDPFYDENERSSAPPSPVAVKRQGLSRSALRSHQPVARPIPVGLHRRGLSIPEPRAVTEAAPVPDLLGSIMSGQSMLMMDSSDVVINRDGSLKAIKPVSVSSPKAAVSKVSGSACSPAAEVHTGSGPSGCGASPPGRPSSMSTSLPLPPTSPQPGFLPPLRHANTPRDSQPRPSPHPLGSPSGVNPTGSRLNGAFRGRDPTTLTIATEMGAIKKPPPKPMWEDVSALPRIPKIKRAAEADENRSRGSRLPDSCVSNLAGTRGRQQAVEQGSSRSEQERVEGGGKPGQDGAGTSSGLSHSSSFSSSSSGSAVTPGGSSSSSSSSTVSFRINASANSWHARRLAGIGSFSNPLEVARDDSWKKRLKSKQLLLSSMRSQSKDTAVKAEVYDPFDPTGSDSAESDSAPEMENAGSATQFPELAIPQGKKPSVSELASQGSNTEGTSHCIKAETLQGDPMEIDGEQMDIDNSSDEEGKQLLERLEVKKEPKDVKEEEELGSVAKDEVEVPEDMVVKEELEGPELSVMMGCGQTTTKPEALSPQLPSEGQNDKATKGCEEVNPDPRQNTLPSKSSRFRSRSRSSSASSHREEKSVKPEQKRPSRNHHSRSKSRSRSRSRSSADRKRVSGRRKRSKERRSSSGSPDGRRRKTEAGGRSQVKRTRRSRSKERRKTRSPSDSSHSEGSERSRRNRRRSRSRDRRRSRSSSEERSRRRKHRRDSRERYSRKERKRSKESKDRRRGRSWSRSKSRSRSRSRSLSRSRDRRKDRKWSQSSSRSKDRARSRSKERRRARSRSRERRTEGRSSQSSRSPAIRSSQKTARSSASDPKNARDTKEIRKEKIVSPSAIKLESKPEQEPGAVKAERPSLVKDTELKVIKVETTVSLSAVKDDDFSETEIKRTVSFSSMKKEEDLKETNNKIIVSNSEAEEQQRNGEDAKNAKPFPLVLVKEENEPEEVSRENLVPLAPVKAESRPADCEERLASVRCEEGEHFTTLEGENKDEKTDQKKDTMEVVLKTAELPEIECKMEPSLPEPAAQSPCISIKREPSPDLESCPQWVSSGSASLNAIAIEYEEEGEEVALPSKADVLKQEKEELSTDEDFNVDYILDCLDSVRNKKAETAGERQSEKGAAAVDASVDKTDTPPAAVAPETEPVPVTANAKPKPAGKRVTWNLQDADQPSAEKTGKIPLHKMKQSQKEGSRKSAALSLPSEQKQEFAQPAAVPSGDPTAPGAMATAPSAGPSGSQVQADVQDPTTAGSKKEGETQDPSRTDKYMKKLHMQERAVEEVKLAIKPFYQKRTITKEEYKDILRKAVQKVCHSKSGEINPVKVANLVKAYVDKYRHARKHKKDDGGKSQEDEKTKDSDTP